VALIVLFGLPTMASMLSPDPITILVYTAGFAAFLSARWRVASALFVVAVFLRPDSAVTNFVLAAAMLACAPREAVVGDRHSRCDHAGKQAGSAGRNPPSCAGGHHDGPVRGLSCDRDQALQPGAVRNLPERPACRRIGR
jgi:hypothetical protein